VPLKIVAGLGNPGPEYDSTRHNVGWWAVDRLAYDWGMGPFTREGKALVASGKVQGESVLLVKPTAFMNRSGPALLPFLMEPETLPERDLLVVVDDAALDVGRVRLRPGGSPGGHNGLASVTAALGTEQFSRLRIGVGRPPAGESLVEWVLSAMPEQDEDVIVGLLPTLTLGVEVWMEEGAEAAMNRINR
jgi:PTH1 family peptidyl-tRNA hydrolase